METKLKAIYLDLDGVCVDMWKGIADLVGMDRDLFYTKEHSNYDACTKILGKHLGRDNFQSKDFVALMATGGWELWANLPKFPWTDDLFELCRSTVPTVIMTRPAPNPESAHGKMAWIQKNYPDIERFAITPCKHHLAHPGGLLIDDSVEGTAKFREHGGWAYTFPQPWNDPNWENRDPLQEIRDQIKEIG